jgi:EAL domain-containing protein (putative c-di-GMP-specific phosphodiesterase class I)
MTWPALLAVAVNLSPAQFKDPCLVRKIERALTNSGLDPNRLELEITESVLLRDDDLTMKALYALRALGVRIALDDFGTGYSSLSYLRSFPFNRIKIDQSFIQGLGVTKDAGAIVRAITTLGHSLEMAVTADGVETPGQLAFLKTEGCNQLQGYLISPPVPASEVTSLIERLHEGGGKQYNWPQREMNA